MQENNVKGIGRLSGTSSIEEVIIWVIFESVNTESFIIEPLAGILNKLDNCYIKLTNRLTAEEIILSPKKGATGHKEISYINRSERPEYFKIVSYPVM